jgi:hypothetical protein
MVNSRPSTNVLPVGDLFQCISCMFHVSWLLFLHTAQIKGGEADVADAQLLGGCMSCQLHAEQLGR